MTRPFLFKYLFRLLLSLNYTHKNKSNNSWYRQVHYTTWSFATSPCGVSSSVLKGILTGGKETFNSFRLTSSTTFLDLTFAKRCFSIHNIITPTPRYVAAAQLHAADASQVFGLYSSSRQPSHWEASAARCSHRPVQRSYWKKQRRIDPAVMKMEAER